MSIGRTLVASSKNWGCEENQKLAMLLFVQRIRELLLHTTSIAAKPLFASPLTIAREILYILSQHSITPHTSTETNVKFLVSEFNDAISNDSVARHAIGDRLKHLTSCLLNFSDSRSQVEAAHFIVARFSIKSYTGDCAAGIIDVIEMGGKKKRELFSLSESFISAIKEAGYPTQTIYHLLNVSFFDHQRVAMSARERLNRFFSNFDFEYHSYVVYFGLNDIAAKVTGAFTSVSGAFLPVDSEECKTFLASISSVNLRFFSEHGFDGIVKFSEIRALDPQSARVLAERRLRLLDDLLRFSVHRRRFIIRNQALVQVTKDKGISFVNSNRPKPPVLLVPHEPDTGHEGLMDLAAALRRTRSGSNERFVRAIELHGTALSAVEEESQLLNIWIALETLFVSGRNGSKVKEIIDSVGPYVSVAWNQYLFSELWERIEHIHQKRWTESVSDSPELVGKIGFLQFVMAVSISKFEPAMAKFLAQLDSDPLLRYKIFSMIEWSQSAKTIREYTSKIDRKVIGDLNRIYRTRNQIVHTGGSKGSLSEVVQSAHYYLDLVIALLSFMLGAEKGCKSIEQANIETKIRYENFISDTTTAANNGITCDESNYNDLLFGRALLT